MIDIIIPAYNSNETIINTLISINMQTIKDKVKVYIINDASESSFDDVLNLFKDKLYIKIINSKVNKGPGISRNIGLDNSNSKYVLFLDSDDELYNSLSLELLLKNICDNDVCIGSVLTEYPNDNYEVVNNAIGSLHGKLYLREFIDKNDLRFNDTYTSEDNSFHNLLLLYNPNIKIINIPVYYYKYNQNSLSDVGFDVFIKEFNYNVSWVINEAIKRKIDKKSIALYLYKKFIYNYQLYLNFNCEFEEVIDSFKKYLLNYLKDYICLLSDDEKLVILNENPIRNISYISLDDFYDLIIK